MPELTAIVPFFNEARTLKELVGAISQLPDGTLSQTIFVNDGSGDDSEFVLRKALSSAKFPSEYIVKSNGGKASAIFAGLNKVKTSHVVILDADLELDPREIVNLWRPISLGEAEAVFGYREFRSQTSYTYRYAMGNRFISHLYGILFNQVITDIMCGFKIIPTAILEGTPRKAKGFAIEVAIPVALWKKSIKPNEIPVSYSPRSRHEGKIINVVDALAVIVNLITLRMLNRKPRQS